MSERIGIIPTAGVKKIERLGHSIVEPDCEGKIRCLAALTDLAHGQIDEIYVTGGMLDQGEPLSKAYVPYIQRQSNRYDFDPSQIIRLPGDCNTSSDFKRALEIMGKEPLNKSIIYSSREHNRRISQRLKSFGVKSARTKTAEEITSFRSIRHAKVVSKIMDEVRKRTTLHELLGVLPNLFDRIPLVGKLMLGYKLEVARARRERQGERQPNIN